MIQIAEIAKVHGELGNTLLAKARKEGFLYIKSSTTTIDTITAEALELAVYGKHLIDYSKYRRGRSNGISGTAARLANLTVATAKIHRMLTAQDDPLAVRASAIPLGLVNK